MATNHTIYLTTVGIPVNYDGVKDILFGLVPTFVTSELWQPYTEAVPIWQWIVTFATDDPPNFTPYLTAMIYPGMSIVELTIT
jgi:hypothetical protein